MKGNWTDADEAMVREACARDRWHCEPTAEHLEDLAHNWSSALSEGCICPTLRRVVEQALRASEAEIAAWRDRCLRAERELAEAGLRGSPPPGVEPLVPALMHARDKALSEAARLNWELKRLTTDKRRCHALLQHAFAVIDPEKHEKLSREIGDELEGRCEPGKCVDACEREKTQLSRESYESKAREAALVEALRDLREAVTGVYQTGRIEALAFVKAGNVLAAHDAAQQRDQRKDGEG